MVQYNSTQLNPKNPQYATVANIIKHEGYNPTITIHDIALVRLREPINLNTNLRKVDLPNINKQKYENTETFLLGWGLNKVLIKFPTPSFLSI